MILNKAADGRKLESRLPANIAQQLCLYCEYAAAGSGFVAVRISPFKRLDRLHVDLLAIAGDSDFGTTQRLQAIGRCEISYLRTFLFRFRVILRHLEQQEWGV